MAKKKLIIPESMTIQNVTNRDVSDGNRMIKPNGLTTVDGALAESLIILGSFVEVKEDIPDISSELSEADAPSALEVDIVSDDEPDAAA